MGDGARGRTANARPATEQAANPQPRVKPAPRERISAGRQSAAIVLMILCFYGVSLAAALALAAFAVLLILRGRIFSIVLAVTCASSALAIVRTVIPRREPFEAPGPRITARQEPELFKAIAEVAHAVGERPPDDVFIVADINAAVMEHGGFLGFRGRRALMFGLPLAQVLTVTEFKSVLAHEFGHFQAKDTKLSPWVYRMRMAIGQSLARLEHGLLEIPTLWFGKLFLKTSMRLSRETEFDADAVAARVAGPRASIDALRKVERVAPLFPAYWSSEAVPLLQARYRPSITEGFARFLQAKRVRTQLAKKFQEAIEARKASEYDSHPPTGERVAAIEALPAAKSRLRVADDPRPAISMLRTLEAIEFDLLVGLGGAEACIELDPIDWNAAGGAVYLPMWAKTVERLRPKLLALDPSDLPGRALDVDWMTRTLVRAEWQDAPHAQRQSIGLWTLGAALAHLLHRKGHRIDCTVGEVITFHHRDSTPRGDDGVGGDASNDTLARMAPFEVLWDLAERKITATEWAEQCEAFGITGAGLGGEDLDLTV